jgi:adenylate cyclase
VSHLSILGPCSAVCQPGEVAWRDRLTGSLQRLADLGVDADDAEHLSLDKRILTLVTSLFAVMSFAWIAMYLAMGLPRSAAIPFAYQICAVASLVVFSRTKRLGPIRTAQLALMLMLPFALQWSLGGFANGSAVAAWAVITPVLAYLFGAARPTTWLVAFVSLLVVSALFETTLARSAPDIAPGVRAAMFALNLAGPSIAVFLSIRYFVTQLDQARSALAHEHRLLEAEQERSERLLLNVLPAPIADQLLGGAVTIAESQPEVTVLFADIVGFTQLSVTIAAHELVDLLNEIFVRFDDLAEAAGLEKIKTIGDAYMVAGGLPMPRADHLPAVLGLALTMRDVITQIPTPNGEDLQLRIGIDTGPVVAGVIGRRKFSYDVWGDTVNMASRMESQGVPGEIQVTERVARASTQEFDFEPRRPIEIKGKGPTRTFLLVGRKRLGALPD